MQAKLSDLNYQIVNRFDKDFLMLIKRLKKPYNQNVWKSRPKQKTNHRKRKAKEDAENKQEDQEKEEGFVITRHAIVTGILKVDDQIQDHGKAAQGSSRGIDNLPKAHNLSSPLTQRMSNKTTFLLNQPARSMNSLLLRRNNLTPDYALECKLYKGKRGRAYELQLSESKKGAYMYTRRATNYRESNTILFLS
jgi:ABC-type glutathione transport system ATPase component